MNDETSDDLYEVSESERARLAAVGVVFDDEMHECVYSEHEARFIIRRAESHAFVAWLDADADE